MAAMEHSMFSCAVGADAAEEAAYRYGLQYLIVVLMRLCAVTGRLLTATSLAQRVDRSSDTRQ